MIVRPEPGVVRGTIGRRDWIDFVRGSALLLVVLAHVAAIPGAFGSGPLPVLPELLQTTRPVRMPAFMVLSGMFLGPALAKGTARFIRSRLAAMLWPFAIWSPVCAVLWLGRDWRTVLGAVVFPELDDPMWYLWFLLAFSTIGPSVRRIPVVVTVPSSLVLCALAFHLPGAEALLGVQGAEYVVRFGYLFAFFLIGDHLGRNPQQLDALMGNRVVVATAALGALALAVLTFSIEDIRFRPEFAVGTMCALLVWFVVARAAVGPGRLRVVRWFGRNSIATYAVHYPVLKVVVVGLGAIGVTGSWSLFVVALAAALATGALATVWYERSSLGAWAFRFGGRARVRGVRHNRSRA